MKFWTNILMGFVALISLAGCELFVTRESLRETEQKKEMTALQRSTADVSNRFAEIEAEQRQMTGRIEVLENRLTQTQTDKDKNKKLSEDQAADTQKKIVVLQEEVARLNDQVAALATELTNLRASEGAATAAASKDSAKSAYDAAEDLFEKKDYKKAILNYNKFRDARPKDKRVADAVLKIGISFQELGMKEEAKTFYEEVVSKYPNSPEAKRARLRIKKIK